ncbi:S-protein homolog 29-like [Vicia villosa]|uniref:S-protein homolog 29-like n=1 Tax=Vicia villosa TaxID=3911 RepID=UPI00273C1577|nr:S-protein homolog 29-like [Vicia villosa]
MAYSNSILLNFSILVVFLFKVKEITAFDRTVHLSNKDVKPSSIFDRTVHLSIKDVIPSSPKDPIRLTVHCKSKDDDLGLHTLDFGGTYTFTFAPILFPRWVNTLYFCSFTWNRNPHRHYLDVYNQKINNCKHCNWNISKTGGCLNNKCQNWKSIELIEANSTSKM